jgi:hypothetical protein
MRTFSVPSGLMRERRAESTQPSESAPGGDGQSSFQRGKIVEFGSLSYVYRT